MIPSEEIRIVCGDKNCVWNARHERFNGNPPNYSLSNNCCKLEEIGLCTDFMSYETALRKGLVRKKEVNT